MFGLRRSLLVILPQVRYYFSDAEGMGGLFCPGGVRTKTYIRDVQPAPLPTALPYAYSRVTGHLLKIPVEKKLASSTFQCDEMGA